MDSRLDRRLGQALFPTAPFPIYTIKLCIVVSDVDPMRRPNQAQFAMGSDVADHPPGILAQRQAIRLGQIL